MAPTSMSDSSHVRPYVSHRPTATESSSSRDEQRAGLDRGVGARELQERDRDLTMLGLAARHGKVVAQRAGTYSSRSRPGTSGGGGIVLAPGARRVIRRAPSRSSASQPVELGGRLGADDDLTRRCKILELEHASRRRAGDEELPVGLGGEEEMA